MIDSLSFSTSVLALVVVLLFAGALLAGCSGEPQPPFAQLYRIGKEASPFKGYIVAEYADGLVQFKTCEGNVIRIERSELNLERGKC